MSSTSGLWSRAVSWWSRSSKCRTPRQYVCSWNPLSTLKNFCWFSTDSSRPLLETCSWPPRGLWPAVWETLSLSVPVLCPTQEYQDSYLVDWFSLYAGEKMRDAKQAVYSKVNRVDRYFEIVKGWIKLGRGELCPDCERAEFRGNSQLRHLGF